MVDALIRQLAKAKDDSVTKSDTRDYGEVTTSIDLIDKQIDLLPKSALKLSNTVLDPCTGDGRYLMRYLYHRMPLIHSSNDLCKAVMTLYGCDIQESNVILARKNIIKVALKIAEIKHIDAPVGVLALIVNFNIQHRSFIDECR